MDEMTKEKNKSVQACEAASGDSYGTFDDEARTCERFNEGQAEESCDIEGGCCGCRRCCEDRRWEDEDGEWDDFMDECPCCGRPFSESSSRCCYGFDCRRRGDGHCRWRWSKNTCLDMAMAAGKTIALSAVATTTTMLVTAVLRRVIR